MSRDKATNLRNNAKNGGSPENDKKNDSVNNIDGFTGFWLFLLCTSGLLIFSVQ